MDKKKIEDAVKLFLEGIGEDVNREGLQDTPRRIAEMCEDLFGGLDIDADEHLQKNFYCQ
jgi:GTP cyclohydrolase I